MAPPVRSDRPDAGLALGPKDRLGRGARQRPNDQPARLPRVNDVVDEGRAGGDVEVDRTAELRDQVGPRLVRIGRGGDGLAVDDDTVSTVEGVTLFTKDIFPSEYEAWIDSLLREQGVNDIQDLSFMKFFGNNK